MAEAPPLADLCGYTPPVSLWKVIESHVPPHELSEIKNMLGETEVEETLELHLEVDMLLDIWWDFRNSTNNEMGSRPTTLPEPPEVRTKLIKEIEFFMGNIKEKSRKKGRDPSKVFAHHKKDVLDYVLSKTTGGISRDKAGSCRPETSTGSDGRETPLMRNTPNSSDRDSFSSSVSDEVDAMADKLNILKLDEVTTSLSRYLVEEKEALNNDVKFLQQCIEDEALYREGASKQEPTLSELKEERTKLERDYLEDVSPNMPDTKLNSGPRQGSVTAQYMPPTKKPLNHSPLTAVRPRSTGIGRPPLVAVHDFHLSGGDRSAAMIRFSNSSSSQDEDISPGITPTPPLERPSSASRFRRMVLASREAS